MCVRFGYPLFNEQKYNYEGIPFLWAEDEFYNESNKTTTVVKISMVTKFYSVENEIASNLIIHDYILVGA